MPRRLVQNIALPAWCAAHVWAPFRAAVQLLLDLTSRGLTSELNKRWQARNTPSPSPERSAPAAAAEVDLAALGLAKGDFVAAPEFTGARQGYVFKLGCAGLGYYIDEPSGGTAKVSRLLQGMLKRFEAEELERRARKRERKEEKKLKKKEKRKKKDRKERREKKDGKDPNDEERRERAEVDEQDGSAASDSS
eukprot:6185665-Pleurochrysis_carterae.AAC.2